MQTRPSASSSASLSFFHNWLALILILPPRVERRQLDQDECIYTFGYIRVAIELTNFLHLSTFIYLSIYLFVPRRGCGKRSDEPLHLFAPLYFCNN